MPARPMSGQIGQIQKETTPGTALTTAMKRVAGLRVIPGYGGEATPYKGLTGKVATGVTLNDTWGEGDVTGVQDFNAIGYVAASRISTPVITTPGGGTLSRQAVFTLNPNAADTFQTYTVQFGDTVQALQATFGVFNSLGIQIERGNLDFSSSWLSRTPTTLGTIVTAGTSVIPSVPIPGKNYGVWADDTWATLGTTREVACYRMNINLGDKFGRDAPINETISSFESLLEQQEQDYGFDAVFGFDAAASSKIATFNAGATKYFRVKALGPLIETTINYSIQVDFAAVITSIGTPTAGDSGAVTLPVNLELASDGTNSCVLTLINTLTNYN
jgi:hypothetical protein